MSGAEVALTAGKVLFSKSSYDFFFKWEHDKSLLDELETQVNSTKALLNVADTRRMEADTNVDKWYQKAQYAVLDAEDLIAIIHTDINMEVYRLGESPRTNDVIKEKFKYKGKDIVRSIHPYKSTRETEMREAIQKLQLIEAQAIPLGLDKNDKLIEFKKNRMTTSYVIDPLKIFGRSDDEKEIVKLLNSREGNDDPLRIISIIGMAGVGKTTLASMVYNGSETSDQLYQVKGWVCVSDKSELHQVIKSLLESITGHSNASDKLETLQIEMKSVLDGKRFLIVLDDVWSTDVNIENKWETLRTIFSVGASGSRILVTTREENVVKMVSKSLESSYKLNELSDAESWSLFQSYAFEHGDSTAYPPSLEKIGKDLVGKCKGSPLALKMLGRLLLSKENDEKEWNFVLRSKVWNSTNKILPSLWLSYYHLLMPVKQCFAYLSIFPKDHIYHMDEMVIFWVAEGLVEKPPQSSNGSYDYEHVGRTYFKHLISNLFIQKSSIDDSGFVMHDLVHDLAEYVSKDLLVNLTDIKIESRRLYPNEISLSQLRSVSKLRRLRTFLVGGISFDGLLHLAFCRDSNKLLSNFKHLRVLSLENESISTLPTSIGDMKLLSYLNLANTDIEYLPKWISRLYNLQFLQLSNCWRLKRLPPNLFDLVNLRLLIINHPILEEMPDGIGRLTNLRILSNYVLSKDKSKQMRDFRRLLNLQGRLEISGLNNVDDVNDVVTASFKNMEYLEELVLSWYTIQVRGENLDERVLDAIQPHNNLKRLTIDGYGGKRLSNWIVKGSPSLTGIVSLSIIECYNLYVLPPLGDLRFLKDLNIHGLDSLVSVGEELYGNSGNPFPALQILKISNMYVMNTWSSPAVGRTRSGFSSLRELQIIYCIKLTEFPGCFPSLASLKIEHCHKLGNLPPIGNLPFLKDVRIDELHSSESLGEEFYGDACIPFPALEKLEISNMESLKKWYSLGGDREGFVSLKELRIRNCPELTKIPYCFPSLIKLEIECCDNLVGMEMHDTIQKGSASSLKTYGYSLQSLSISNCPELEEIPMYFLNLLELTISGCEGLMSVLRTKHVQNFDLEKVDDLLRVEAELQDCPEVKINVTETSLNIGTGKITGLEGLDPDIPIPEISSKDEDIHELKELQLSNCTNLARLPDVFSAIGSLQTLLLERCSLIQHFQTSSGLLFNSLCYLYVSRCPALESLPENFQDITTLRTLYIENCPNLIAPKDGFPRMVRHLTVSNCGKMEPVSKMKLSRLTSLTYLYLEGFPETSRLDDCIPDSIESLKIISFPRLESLSEVPSIIKLQRDIYIEDCPLNSRAKEELVNQAERHFSTTDITCTTVIHARRETNLVIIKLQRLQGK